MTATNTFTAAAFELCRLLPERADYWRASMVQNRDDFEKFVYILNPQLSARSVEGIADALLMPNNYNREVWLAILQDSIRNADKVARAFFRDVNQGEESEEIAMAQTQEMYSLEGNLIRKQGGSSTATLPRPEPVTLSFWSADCLSDDEEQALTMSIGAVLGIHAAPIRISMAVRGSFFKFFTFLVSGRQYIARALVNLRSAFQSTVAKSDSENLLRLSTILQKHPNIVIRSENFIAVKITKGRESSSIIESLAPHVQEMLARDPTLMVDPVRLYELFQPSPVPIKATSRARKPKDPLPDDHADRR